MLVVTENVFILIHFFRPPFFLFLLRRNLFSKRECSDQKTYLAKVEGSAQKPFQTPSTILGPLAAIVGFAGGVALQAVSKCPQRRYAGILREIDAPPPGFSELQN